LNFNTGYALPQAYCAASIIFRRALPWNAYEHFACKVKEVHEPDNFYNVPSFARGVSVFKQNDVIPMNRQATGENPLPGEDQGKPFLFRKIFFFERDQVFDLFCGKPKPTA